MTAVVIPWQKAVAWSQQVALSGAIYTIRAHFNGESDRWTLSLYDKNRSAIVEGISVVKDYSLLSACRTVNAPSGDFYAIGSGEPTRENMGDGVQLVYLELTE